MVNASTMDVLEEQVEFYRRLEKLAARQHECVQQSDTEGLIEVLEQRKVVVDRITELERELAPAKQEWKRGVEVGDAEKLLAEAKTLLARITAADRDDAMVLQQRKLNLGRQIKQASAAKLVNRNYAAAAYGTRAASLDDRG